MRRTAACSTFLVLLLSLPAAASIAAPRRGNQATGQTFAYSGRIIGPNDSPVSGIFNLRFSLHRSKNAKSHLWQEVHEVAVVNGAYRVDLGRRSPIARRHHLEKMVIAVGLVGGPELVRQDLGPLLKAAEKDPVPLEGSSPADGGASHPTPGTAASTRPKGTVVDYADRAGYALEADHAGTADKLDGKTLEEVARYMKEELGGGKVKVGRVRKLSGHVGGRGGGAYEEVCPPGYLVVGIRGNAGMYIDGIELICAPIERK